MSKMLAAGNLKKPIILFVLICQLATGNRQPAFAQQPPTPIKRSDKTETIDGKKFYIHPVEKGQTLYSIAKTYSTTVDIVLSNNQDMVDGLKTGEQLKIPFTGNVEKIKNAIGIPNQKRDSVIISVENVVPIGDIHVALFLPLSLAMMESMDVGKIANGDEKIPEEIKTGIEFYEGMKLAFDSLRKQGFKGYLHVYDSNPDSAGFAKLMKKQELKEMDLIMGPLFGKRINEALKFSKKNNIRFVAPAILGNNILLGNQNVSKMMPSYITQSEELAKYIVEKYAGQNIIVFNSANHKDKPYLSTFKKTANAILSRSNADTVKEITFVSLKNFINKTKLNVVVIPSVNPSFITEAVNTLYRYREESKDSIIIFGMSNWEGIESLDLGCLNALYAHISSCSFVDYTNPQTKNFVLKYRKEFKTEPSSYVFLGFDAGYFYLSGLQQYGTSFHGKLPELKHKGIQTEFNFYQSDLNSGYENRGVGIMKFENYSWKRCE